MKHVKWECKLGYELCSQCNYDSHSELFTCAVCDGSEGELTTDCKGGLMTNEEKERVYSGSLDFKDGTWKNK